MLLRNAYDRSTVGEQLQPTRRRIFISGAIICVLMRLHICALFSLAHANVRATNQARCAVLATALGERGAMDATAGTRVLAGTAQRVHAARAVRPVDVSRVPVSHAHVRPLEPLLNSLHR